MSNILVTGGCGFKGAVLVPKLIAAGHDVLAVDTMWFGPGFPGQCGAMCADVREPDKFISPWLSDFESTPKKFDTIIHLANIANDPCGNLAPDLTWEISAHGTQVLADAAVKAGVKHFIYASSASVYGISDADRVTEDLPCFPLSVYNRSKLAAERILLSYADKMAVTIIRPATVCGLSPNQRLDVVVNLLTIQALNRGRITVLGGNQHRPNIHIEDITDLYCWLVERPEITGVFNAGAENLTVSNIGDLVKARTHAQVTKQESNDDRSYRLDSSKLAAAGWSPKRTVLQAIDEMVMAHNTGELIETDTAYRVNWLRHMRSEGRAIT
jgi:nucleoside-diphosphate-sugar epimerase